MNIKNILVGTAVSAVMFGAMIIPALATAEPVASEVLVKNWMVYNRSADFAKLWDNNKATALEKGGVGFTFNLESTTWYTAYLKAHYNGDLTDKTITANVSVTGITGSNSPTFVSNPIFGVGPPTVGLVIKSKEGNWGPNDYWFSTSPPLLSSLGDTGLEIITSTSDRGLWINLAGMYANDTTASWTYDGTLQKESPSEGFTNALKNVREVGLSFNGPSRRAAGVALTGGTAFFQLNSFTVTP